MKWEITRNRRTRAESCGDAMTRSNEYADQLGQDLYEVIPKSVLAAIAVSALTTGGDYLEEARERVVEEWSILFQNGIVRQKPPNVSRRVKHEPHAGTLENRKWFAPNAAIKKARGE